MDVIVVGGGWAGCAAALEAAKSGKTVALFERTDMLIGTGLVGGIIRNNGRFTATAELDALGGGDLFSAIDSCIRHKNINFPGHEHADLYDISSTPIAVKNALLQAGVTIFLQTRIAKVETENDSIIAVIDDKGQSYKGSVFIDATGTAGPMNNCGKYGNGCAMCILRCPSFGGRISLAGLCGLNELMGLRADGSIGAMSGSCKLYKESLDPSIVTCLNNTGVAIIPLPEHLKENHLDKKACQQYALQEYADNLILLDTGHAKMMTPFFPLEKLQQVPGFEDARFEDPYAGGKGNSMRFFAMCHCNDSLKVDSINNLFCAGEKAGLLVGHTEAIITGVLSGFNAIQFLSGNNLLTLPTTLAIGDAISLVHTQMETQEGLSKKYTFSGSILFERMTEKTLDSTDT